MVALQRTTHCNTLQHTATHCNTLQHTRPNPDKVPKKENVKSQVATKFTMYNDYKANFLSDFNKVMITMPEEEEEGGVEAGGRGGRTRKSRVGSVSSDEGV